MEEQKFCMACGAPVGDQRFCTSCGEPLAAASVPRAPVAPPPSAPPPSAPPPSAPPPSAPPPVAAAPAYAGGAGHAGTDRRRPGLLGWVLIGVLAVLLVGGASYGLGVATRDDDTTSGTTPQMAADATGSSARGKAESESADSTTAAGEKAAQALSKLIDSSSRDRSSIAGAASDLGACRNVAAAISAFEGAAQSRARLVKEVERIDVSALPGGADVVGNLRSAWTKSEQADQAYAKWGATVKATGKGKKRKCHGDGALLRTASSLSVESHPFKRAAARDWAKIAEQYDLPAVGWRKL